MIELELTYLAKSFPANVKSFPFKEIIDLYVPESLRHPKIRIRKNGEKFEITKKEPVSGTDSSRMLEQTIRITEEEFNGLLSTPSKKVHKIRYHVPFNGLTAEVDVFQGGLRGLVLVDFEFKTIQQKDSFSMPSFCLADVTQEKFAAGGMLCGKTYSDIERELKRYRYNPLFLD